MAGPFKNFMRHLSAPEQNGHSGNHICLLVCREKIIGQTRYVSKLCIVAFCLYNLIFRVYISGKPVTTSVPSISIKFHANAEQIEELYMSEDESNTTVDKTEKQPLLSSSPSNTG